MSSQSEKCPDQPPAAPVQGSFDKGARIDPNKPINIPPPPPGTQPTPAQVAAAKGQSVAMVHGTAGGAVSSPTGTQSEPVKQGTCDPQPPPVQGTFDQGARFDPSKPVQVPPPPPGVQPTPAQIAAAQGQSIIMVQEQKKTWTGGSDGGAGW